MRSIWPIDLSVESVTKTFGDFTAVSDVSFTVEKGRFFSILGPVGMRENHLLRMIAGFIEPTGGRILIRGSDMAGYPPNRRPVNLIFQHLALFPMMNVAQNIAFGLQRRREKKPDIDRKVAEILERVGLPGFGAKRSTSCPAGRSSGWPLPAAWCWTPPCCCWTSPLGALDLKLREQMKVELKKLQAQVGTTFIYITHDQSEALVMSDHVAVMNNGRFEQVDTPRNLYAHPKTPFVARFVGDNNAWKGTVADRQR
jgi:spermidine/putrescine transport system ATP-binding protein